MTVTDSVSVVVLAAGMGTRMKSDLPKVLHQIGGRSMIGHVLAASAQLNPRRTVVVTAPGMDRVRTALADDAEHAIQDPPLGTGHAVMAARDLLSDVDGTVLVLFADSPLITSETLKAMVAALAEGEGAAISVLGFRPMDRLRFARLITNQDGTLDRIVEHADATPEELEIDLCNSGFMAVRARELWPLLDAIGNDNAKGEYYLTDIVALARQKGLRCVVTDAPADEALGVDAREQLARAEAIFQGRLRRLAMAEGATLIDPDSTFLSHDTAIGRDVVIEPNVVIGPGVTIGDNVTICAFSHLTGKDAKSDAGLDIAAGATIGPFARIRPGSKLGRDAHIGNFVEVKNSEIADGAKANHLTYLGDTTVGPKTNIGAGTITCNYDGVAKHRTQIGGGSFIGSNSTLVAPVEIGDGAYVAAGSVVTEKVPADALAFGRSRQQNKEGAAGKLRKKQGKTD